MYKIFGEFFSNNNFFFTQSLNREQSYKLINKYCYTVYLLLISDKQTIYVLLNKE